MSEKARKLERFFYEKPETRIHLRKLAEEIEVSPGFVSNNIAPLLDKGVVEETREGNMRFFSANTSDSGYRRRKRAFNTAEVLKPGLVPTWRKN